MKKFTIVVASAVLAFLLASCGKQYEYEVSYEKCNGSYTGAAKYVGDDWQKPFIANAHTRKHVSPEPRLIMWESGEVRQVCKFTYTQKEIFPNVPDNRK